MLHAVKSDEELRLVDVGSLRAVSVVPGESDDGFRREAWARTTWWLVPLMPFCAAEDFPVLIFGTRIKDLPRRLIPLNGIGAGSRGCRNLVSQQRNRSACRRETTLPKSRLVSFRPIS